MKDHLIAILETVRLSQAALAERVEQGAPGAEATLRKLKSILNDQPVVAAMESLYLAIESPSIRPDASVDSAAERQSKDGKLITDLDEHP